MRTAASGALNDMYGEIGRNATFNEDIFFTDEDGDPYDISSLDWQFTLRKCIDQDSADISLTIGDGLSIETDADSGETCILRISGGIPSSLDSGDYYADLSYQDSSDNIVLVASGLISVANSPVSWS